MSSSDALSAYLGWTRPAHRPDCARPSWEVDLRTEFGQHRNRRGGPAHSCPNDDCDHGDQYEEVTVRLLCRSCQVVRLITGEEQSDRSTTTASTGYGQAPKPVAGLWLYPGPPLLRLHDSTPYSYLCTLERVEQLDEKDIVGTIVEGRGSRGATVWSAAALLEVRHLPSVRTEPYFTWKTVSGDTAFKTVAAAAKWVKAAVDAAATEKEVAE
ncbi:hypothetical protein OHS33_39580 (plasmid) [Streptomyces sp. NBC_00536]|uniref:hypothetical protein n=1 Tax=Streptomyces sp. NBC_00536 TaxID=2975769 RepID=UPI002E81C446|nr:hypothetical protein [Streptomyces sp. NBC_00536]WUC84469.1 hypothetical protein OHS33_39580 [Streptomyces sp. NBC_00536]